MTFKNRISICLICCCLPFVSACQATTAKPAAESTAPNIQSDQPAATPHRFAAIPARHTGRGGSTLVDFRYQTTTMAVIS